MAPGFLDATVCRSLGMVVEWRHTNVVELNTAWRQRYSATVRQHIRAAQAAVIVHVDNVVDGFEFSRALVQQAPDQVRMRKRFAWCCAGQGRVLCLTATHGTAVVGQQLVLIDSTTGYLMHSWFERNGPRGVPSLLTDTAAAILQSRYSCTCLDLEGSVLPSIDYFMSGFGGAIAPYPYVYWHRERQVLGDMVINGALTGWPGAKKLLPDNRRNHLMMRMLYMPTNRPCESALEHALTECAELTLRTEVDHLFVLIEHCDDYPYVTQHSAVLEPFHRRGVTPVLHLTSAVWQDILGGILDAADMSGIDRQRSVSLLSPSVAAYSAGPNKAFLIASALGIDTVHRRDSDHMPDIREGRPAYPGVLEAEAIGRRLSAVQPIVDADAVPSSQAEAEILFVGSSMYGDPPHDRRALLALGEDLVLGLESLSSPGANPEELMNDVRNYFVEEPQIHYQDDFYELDLTGRTELGVSCLKRIFLEIPEMPIVETLGCDYFQKNLLYQLNRPVLFHSRKMHHQYDSERAEARDIAKYVAYSLRDLRYLILWPIWSRHNRTLRESTGTVLNPDGSVRVDGYAASLAAACEEILPQLTDLPARFAEIYRTGADRTDGEAAKRLRAAAAAADDQGEKALEHVAAGISDYCWLIERWPLLVTAAREVAEPIRGHIREGLGVPDGG